MPPDGPIRSGESLVDRQGFPRLRPAPRALPSARTWIAPLIVIAALAAAVLASLGALWASPAAAVWAEPGGRVMWVLPGGPAWELGIRPGQPVVELVDGEHAEEWRLTTADPAGPTHASAAAMLSRLRGSSVSAVLALVVSLVGFALLWVSSGTAAAAGVVGLLLARAPLLASGDLIMASAATLLVLLAACAWLRSWGPDPVLARVSVAVALGLAGLWLWLRFAAAEDPELSRLHDLAALALTGSTYVLTATVATVVGARAVRSRAGGYDIRAFGDVVVIAAAAVAVPVAFATGVPLLWIGVAVLVLLVGYPLSRRRIGTLLDRLLLGDLRARTTMTAIERERQRMSREIHDEPLQALASVIGRLSRRPGLETETAMLQEVSGQLRGVTMQLHPPILTDLGLGASLGSLVEEVDRAAAATVHLDMREDRGAARPPAEVELAAFRIAQEALANAVRHSAAGTVRVTGIAGPSAIVVTVVDDGVGIDGVSVAQALARGHVGLRSMSERAAIVGGELRIEDARPGTRVTFRWPA
jgi:signal transduction histidine kinase